MLPSHCVSCAKHRYHVHAIRLRAHMSVLVLHILKSQDISQDLPVFSYNQSSIFCLCHLTWQLFGNKSQLPCLPKMASRSHYLHRRLASWRYFEVSRSREIVWQLLELHLSLNLIKLDDRCR